MPEVNSKKTKKMKKLLMLSVVMFAMVCIVKAQNSASASFNLSMTVDKYIETTSSPLSFDFGTTMNHSYYGAVRNEDLYYGANGSWNLAYANCPFSVTLSGQNAAAQNVPRFAKLEEGAHGSGYDILNTVFQIGFWTNGEVQNDAFGHVWGFGASSFPKTANFAEAPHNGQVRMSMTAHVNSHWQNDKDAGIPIRETVINPAFTNIQSADAGVYQCTMLVTLTAL